MLLTELWVLVLVHMMKTMVLIMIVIVKVTVMVKIWFISEKKKCHHILFISEDHQSGFKVNSAHFRAKSKLGSTIRPLLVFITELVLNYEDLGSFPWKWG